jgi:hypothetical protein
MKKIIPELWRPIYSFLFLFLQPEERQRIKLQRNGVRKNTFPPSPLTITGRKVHIWEYRRSVKEYGGGGICNFVVVYINAYGI